MTDFRNGDKVIAEFRKLKNNSLLREEAHFVSTFKEGTFIRYDDMSAGTAAWIQFNNNKCLSRVLLENLRFIEV